MLPSQTIETLSDRRCWAGMDRNAKLAFLARVMIDLYGENAAMVARRRVTECSADREAARIWREVLATVENRQLECISPPP